MVELIANYIVPASLSLLPAQMNTPEARRMLVSIGWQESRLLYRSQIGGPAKGLWQFEKEGGLKGIEQHPQTAALYQRVLSALGYGGIRSRQEVFDILPHNDILACSLARLLLWTHPKPLPLNQFDAWAQYLVVWRPGKPHENTWAQAWAIGEEAI